MRLKLALPGAVRGCQQPVTRFVYFVQLEKIQLEHNLAHWIVTIHHFLFFFNLLEDSWGCSLLLLLLLLPFDFRSFSIHCCWHFPSCTYGARITLSNDTAPDETYCTIFRHIHLFRQHQKR